MIRTVFRHFAYVIIVLAGALQPLPGVADELQQPSDKVVLTVTGKIGNTNQDGAAVFDVEMLKALGDDEITTSTIWTQGEKHFTGVFLNKLLESLDVQGDMVALLAINDYRVEIPLEEALNDPALIAYAIDGEELEVRDKGPLWIIYPFDKSDTFRSEVYYARSIWQFDRVIVEDAE